MSEYVHRTIIVPAAFQQLAQALCEAAAEGDAGKGMFITALSPTGVEPATHYISSGHIEDVFASILPLTTITTDGEETTTTIRYGNVEFVEAMAAQAGINLPEGAIESMFYAIDVSEQGAFEAMARLGVSIVAPQEVL